MDRLRRGLDLILGGLCCGLLVVLVAVLVWQVVSRYALNAPSSVTEEILRYGVIWMSLLGAAYATGRGAHMSVDMLRDRLPARGRLRLDALVAVAFVAFAGIVLIWGGMKGVTIAARQTSAVMRIPMSWVYLSLPVSGVLMIAYSLLNLADLARGRPHHADTLEQAEMLGE
ncbi:TRAP transporter small permease [Paracoccus nototheniae]|uniref:TRAP transporter small permease protein n=1 Tax=Paracoccus nototheniae TaxID=2489002 RepID=A0ABW4DWB0_9RHOB|nr:TRAP transporter small permease [Paracoccus nototheniae]